MKETIKWIIALLGLSVWITRAMIMLCSIDVFMYINGNKEDFSRGLIIALTISFIYRLLIKNILKTVPIIDLKDLHKSMYGQEAITKQKKRKLTKRIEDIIKERGL